jgi:hypothetical protein
LLCGLAGFYAQCPAAANLLRGIFSLLSMELVQKSVIFELAFALFSYVETLFPQFDILELPLLCQFLIFLILLFGTKGYALGARENISNFMFIGSG